MVTVISLSRTGGHCPVCGTHGNSISADASRFAWVRGRSPGGSPRSKEMPPPRSSTHHFLHMINLMRGAETCNSLPRRKSHSCTPQVPATAASVWQRTLDKSCLGKPPRRKHENKNEQLYGEAQVKRKGTLLTRESGVDSQPRITSHVRKSAATSEAPWPQLKKETLCKMDRSVFVQFKPRSTKTAQA